MTPSRWLLAFRFRRHGLRASRRQSIGFRLLPHGRLQLLDVLGRQLRPVDLDRQLVELGGQRERRLVVGVVHAGQRVGADVEALVPLQDHRQRLLHPLCGDHLAVHLERAGAGPADAAEVVERERAGADARRT